MFRHVDISAFRTNFKERDKATAGNQWVNEHFIGTQFNDYSGFFRLFHGKKEEISNFLRANFQMAEDGQAVYEFIQNAADCQSTQFWLFFDDLYFLAINNGAPFTAQGVEAILNIGQSHGKDNGDTIGRYGVGFKLVHRLVGRTDGLEEIVKDNKGPVLFSWSRPEDLNEFLKTDIRYDGQPSTESDAPWLLKILLTCFPAQPGESVKGLNYEPFVPFTQDELEECRLFTAQQLYNIERSELNQGSLFFLRLGKGKSETLQSETRDLANGTGVSFRFLKNLQKIFLNNRSIGHSKLEWLPRAEFQPGSPEFNSFGITDTKMKDWPAIIEVGYLPFLEAGDQLRRAPNFYKFFPLGDEVNGLNFVVHCNVFAHETNRRKLHNQTTNFEILKAASTHIIQKAIEAENSHYLEIFANVLLSEPPTASGKEWQRPYFYDPLLEFFRNYCPALDTDNGCIRTTSTSVVIKGTNLPVHPKNWGIERNWLFWHEQDAESKDLILEVKKSEKIGLASWNLEDLILNGQPANIKSWLLSQWQMPDANYIRETLFKELSEIPENNWRHNFPALLIRMINLPIFHFPNVGFYSINEIKINRDLLILQTGTTQNIASVLSKLGFYVSEYCLGDKEFDKVLFQMIGYSDPKNHFLKIVTKLNDQISAGTIDLTLSERYDLFKCLKNILPEDKKMLRDLALFSNAKGEIQPLRSMLPPYSGGIHFKNYELDVKNAFEIQQNLKEYLCAEKEVFRNIIQAFWLDIAQSQNPGQITSFLQAIFSYFERDENKYNHTLSGQQILFLEEPSGWYLPGSMVFLTQLADLNYEKFQLADRVSRELLGQSLSHPQWSKLLVSPPFNVTGTSSIDVFKDRFRAATLDYAELCAFIELLGPEDFFAHFYVGEENGMATITPRSDKGIQYISEDAQLISFLGDVMPDRIRLPNKLAHLGKSSNMVLSGSDLEEFIVETLSILDVLEPHAARLASLLTTKASATVYLKKMPSFLLTEQEDYDYEDPELSWLRLSLDLFDETDFPKWRRKILIQSLNGHTYSLGQAPASDIINLDGYRLHLSQLFPKDQNQEGNATSQRVLNKLRKAGFQKEKLNMLFGAEEQMPEQDVLNDYLSLLPEYLENAAQVAFHLLCRLRTDVEVPDKAVQVKALNDEWQSLNGDWTLTPRTFIYPGYMFSDSYEGLGKLLKIKKENPVFISDDGTRIVFDFYFDEDKFVSFGWVEEPTPEQSLSAFEYLFELWKTNRLQFELLNINDFTQTLGFQAITSIWPSEYAVGSEVLPENIHQWVGEVLERQKFLTAIKVNTLDSEVVQLRKFLLNPDVDFTVHDLQRAFQLENAIHNALLYNSLKFVHGQVFKDEKHLELLREVYNRIPLPKDFTDHPLLYVNSVDENGQFAYQQTAAVVDDAGFDENTLVRLESFGITNAVFFEFFRQRNFYIFDLKCYPESWLQLETNLIEVYNPQPDWDAINDNVNEWDVDYYLAWKTIDRPSIFVHDGPMPELVFCKPFEDQAIITYYRADFLTDGKNIYINKAKASTELLISAVTNGILDAVELESLVSEKTKNIQSLQPFEWQNGLDFFNGTESPNWHNIEASQQVDINDEAKRMAADWLRQRGYNVPDPIQTNYYRLLNIRNLENTLIRVLVRSARGGNLFLSPTDWSELSEPGALLLVVLPGSKITSLSFEDIMKSKGRINLQFDAQIFTPQSIVLFAKIFHYVQGVKFVIRAPNFSASEYIQSFGLHERLNESASAAPTNLID